MADNGTSFWCLFWGNAAATNDVGQCIAPTFLNFFLIFFFLIWNSACSQIILVPAIRFWFFGCGDHQGRRNLVAIICPHWLLGVIMPFIVGGLFTATFAVGLPYSFVSYKIYKLCKAERSKGKMIKCKEEVDAFLEGEKFMRIDSVRLSNDRLMFSATGKIYDTSKGKTSLNFLLDPTELHVSNDIMALFGGTRSRSVSFTDKGAQNIKLVLTRLVGLENQDSIEVEPLPQRQDSLSQRILNMANPTYQFTAVATPYQTVAPNNFYNAFVPARPVFAVATVVQPPDIEQGPK